MPTALLAPAERGGARVASAQGPEQALADVIPAQRRMWKHARSSSPVACEPPSAIGLCRRAGCRARACNILNTFAHGARKNALTSIRAAATTADVTADLHSLECRRLQGDSQSADLPCEHRDRSCARSTTDTISGSTMGDKALTLCGTAQNLSGTPSRSRHVLLLRG